MRYCLNVFKLIYVNNVLLETNKFICALKHLSRFEFKLVRNYDFRLIRRGLLYTCSSLKESIKIKCLVTSTLFLIKCN